MKESTKLVYFQMFHSKNLILKSGVLITTHCLAKARTSEEMDRTLHTDFAKSRTTWDIFTKFSALLQLWKIWFLTKFEGFSSKIGPATPMGSFFHFWREIQILSTYCLDFLCKADFHKGRQLVKIWCWYLNPPLRN